ncbi:MAG: hypothetical protein LLG44_00610 [Chloroflexi bacterium]|nr:hypothetical protein [Chloroflexota bacterium]
MAKRGRSAAQKRKVNRVPASGAVRTGSAQASQSRPTAQTASAKPSTPTPKAAAGPSISTKKATPPAVDTNAQYAYVLGDLKQLGITAAAMFIVLIVLSLIIH